ncbi:MAG: GyrI-like domain-containing protein [Porphyromonas sp.]|nr:GyrI-like domain-containing protein [Porphyromonas sp.]
MAFDFKKVFKEFYLPPAKPMIVTLPEINYIAVRGKGNPNDEDGEYKEALELLYGVAYALKMSYKSDYKIDGFFLYVIPPLEGLWWTESETMDYNDKSNLCFISMIRLPDFVTEKDLEWAIQETTKKKKKTSRKSSCSATKRVCVYSACTSALTTTKTER